MNRATAFSLLLTGATILFAAHSFAKEKDVQTLSNYRKVAVTHMYMNLKLDLDMHYFVGYVDYTIERKSNDSYLILDTKALLVRQTFVIDKYGKREKIAFTLGETHPILGQALTIPLKDDTVKVRVEYGTKEEPTASGIYWRTQHQDHKKRTPAMVSQFLSTKARSFVPCQDTPAQKIIYDAEIKLTTDNSSGNMRLLMPATERGFLRNSYTFKMHKPIPTSQMAVAAGVFAKKEIGKRVTIFAKPKLIDEAADRFADAEETIAIAESVLGPYPWEHIDIVIMPADLSHGAVTSPTMMFIEPSALTNEHVLAQGLARVWSGGYVTHANWNHLWISESIALYIERLIVEKISHEGALDVEIALRQLYLKDHIDELAGLKPELTRMRLTLSSDDDANALRSDIPFEKGFNMWLALEKAYGAHAVLAFLKGYFLRNKFGFIDSDLLKNSLMKASEFNFTDSSFVDEWIYNEGLPVLPIIKSKNVDEIRAEISKLENTYITCSEVFNAKQWSYLLRLATKVSAEKIEKLNDVCALTQKNDEVRTNFYVLAIDRGLFSKYESEITLFKHKVRHTRFGKAIEKAIRGITP